MARIEDWDDANWKWIQLAERLRNAEWSQHDPRKIKRQLQAGRAIILETNEQVSADRTIYALAVRWKKAAPEGEVQMWIDAERRDVVSEQQMLSDLEERLQSR